VTLTPDRWVAGEKYEPYVGRWSRLVAPRFVDWLELPERLRWADVGCGTGALSDAVLSAANPDRIVALDGSLGFVRYGRERLPDPAVFFGVSDAMRLPLADGAVHVTISGLVLNFLPDTGRALAEMRRVSAPGGTVAGYVWDYAGGMQMMRFFWDAAVAESSAAAEVDEASRFPICRPDNLEAALAKAHLGAVVVHPIEVSTTFADFGRGRT
jgi:ubiquinone/menaquinone biosynthesis C-methylase UbiE